jgi:uncharacterized membrane protein YeiH
MVPGFNPLLILWLNLLGVFVFALSGALAGVRARFDIFGVLVMALVVALAGGVTRDVLLGVPAAGFRDWRYLTIAAVAGVLAFVARTLLERVTNLIQVFDAFGLALFCVTGAAKAVEYHLSPVPAVLLGAVTGVGGGVLRDLLLREVPTVLRQDLYAIPALLGASVVVIAHVEHSTSALFAIIGFILCVVVRLIGVRFNVQLPIAPSERRSQS